MRGGMTMIHLWLKAVPIGAAFFFQYTLRFPGFPMVNRPSPVAVST